MKSFINSTSKQIKDEIIPEDSTENIEFAINTLSKKIKADAIAGKLDIKHTRDLTNLYALNENIKMKKELEKANEEKTNIFDSYITDDDPNIQALYDKIFNQMNTANDNMNKDKK